MGKSLSTIVAEQLRAEMGMLQIRPAELARRLEVSHMYVARRMTGQTPLDLRDLQRIADALGIPVSRLLGAAIDRVEAAA